MHTLDENTWMSSAAALAAGAAMFGGGLPLAQLDSGLGAVGLIAAGIAGIAALWSWSNSGEREAAQLLGPAASLVVQLAFWGVLVVLAGLGEVEAVALASMLIALPLTQLCRRLLARLQLQPARAAELGACCALVALAAALIGLGRELDGARCLSAGGVVLGLSAAVFVPTSLELVLARASGLEGYSRAGAWLLCLLLARESGGALVSSSAAPVELCLHLGFAALLCTLLSSFAWLHAPQLERA